MKTEIKICGLTCADEAMYLKEYNIGMAGIVLFYEKSKRNNTIENASKIVNKLHENSIEAIAVTVSPVLEQIRIIEDLGFDIIQIHGNVDDELLKLIKIPIILAFNVNSIVNLNNQIENKNVYAVLFDGAVSGSGNTFRWEVIKNVNVYDKKIIIAGGLNYKNVPEVINMVKPFAVDVSSSVERPNGGKDKEKIKTFAEAVLRCNGGKEV